MNYFDQLLEAITDTEAKEQFSGIVAKVPVLKDWIVDPTVRQQTEAMTRWAETEWDHDHGMSRREYQQERQLAELQTQLANKRDGMELNELEAYLAKYTSEKGLMTKAEYDAGIKAKEQEFANQLTMVSNLAGRIPYLNGKYQQEFGKMFDPDVFVKEANEKGYAQYGTTGLDKFYEEFTKTEREAKLAADIEAKVAAAKEEGRKAGLQEQIAQQGGGMPEAAGGSEMSHFQQFIMKGNKRGEVDLNAQRVPDEVPFGKGAVGEYAARLADARDRAASIQ